MSDKIDKEIEAIRTVLSTLQGLEDDVRRNVLEYVLKRINFHGVTGLPTMLVQQPQPSHEVLAAPYAQNPSAEGLIHIKIFKENKKPKSAIEMCVLIAYYLEYIAEADKRKTSIGTADLATWFRIADFPLPTGDLRYVLTNAKNAGYLDSVGHGEYKMNAIGYNLVKHNLPRTENGTSQPKPKKKVAKKAVKKSQKK